MANKFAPPLDHVNSVQPKKSGKSLSNSRPGNILKQAKKLIKESYAPDAFAQVGNMRAIVLEVQQGNPDTMAWHQPTLLWMKYGAPQAVPVFARVRIRIPELHAHLPEPKDGEDFAAINLHPFVILAGEKPIPEVGDIITVDFGDKNNFKDGFVVDCLGSSTPPSAGGLCPSASTFNAAAAPLNAEQPEGDTITPEAFAAESTVDADADAAASAAENGTPLQNSGINAPTGDFGYSAPNRFNEETGEWELSSSDGSLYFITKREYDISPEFQSLDELPMALKSKGIYSVALQVAENLNLIADLKKLNRVISRLKTTGISVFLYTTTTEEHASASVTHMINIAKKNTIDGMILQPTGAQDKQRLKNIHNIIRNMCHLMGMPFGYLTVETATSPLSASKVTLEPGDINLLPNIDCDFHFVAYNYYDWQRKNESDGIPAFYNMLYGTLNALEEPLGFASNTIPLLHIDGTNFLSSNTEEPCDDGSRSPSTLYDEIKGAIEENSQAYLGFIGYSALVAEKVSAIKDAGISIETFSTAAALLASQDAEQQNLLNSTETNNQPLLPNAADRLTPDEEADAVAAILNPPTFNDDDAANSQLPSSSAPAAEPAASPGTSCAPMAAGSAPAAIAPDGTYAAAAPDPSYRFDSLPGFESLGYSMDASKMLNPEIKGFLDSLSAAVYRRLPMTDAAVANSHYGKIRITSTLRTPSKQVELMWDKIKNGGGDQAVFGLYGSGAFPTEVVRAYHANDLEGAISYTTNYVAQRAAQGAKGHLYGNGVDVHTWSHLDAEGISSSGASVATMNTSRYIQAILAACAELGARPVVESYQQHVHITLPA